MLINYLEKIETYWEKKIVAVATAKEYFRHLKLKIGSSVPMSKQPLFVHTVE